MASENGIMATVIVASLVNVAGTQLPPWTGRDTKQYPVTKAESAAWKAHNRNPLTPIISGFVVGAVLIGIGEAEPKLAELFAAAFLITSTLLNGVPLLTAATNIATNVPKGTLTNG